MGDGRSTDIKTMGTETISAIIGRYDTEPVTIPSAEFPRFGFVQIDGIGLVRIRVLRAELASRID